jgi:2-aminophenol/2-amino-5-chlorophenol 1,6-dioxygenase alpha subunit
MSEKLFAAWVPGLPHVLQPEKSAHWASLEQGYRTLAADLAAFRPEVIVLYSTQWLSVLGTSFQAHPNPKGVHVDENWYELGDLPFDFRSDSELASRLAAATVSAGLPAKTVSFDEFPIDTGTIVALRFLNPDGKIPVAIVSSCVYCDAAASEKLGRTVRETVERSGKRAAFIACSLLSARFFSQDIDPQADRLSEASDDQWNRRILGLIESGKLAEIAGLTPEYAGQARVDMRFNAFHWLRGALGGESRQGRVLAYGPQWGTGAAVVEFAQTN